jgi:hypothetical protein
VGGGEHRQEDGVISLLSDILRRDTHISLLTKIKGDTQMDRDGRKYGQQSDLISLLY